MKKIKIKSAIHKKERSLLYLWDYFESLSLPTNGLMKLTSMLDLIILHKGELGGGGVGGGEYSGISSPGMGLGILVVPSSRVRKIPSVWLLFLCAV